jgi:hypothetical protein
VIVAKIELLAIDELTGSAMESKCLILGLLEYPLDLDKVSLI